VAADGSAPGGGGGGGKSTTSSFSTGGNGAGGQVTLTYNAAITGTASLPGVGTMTAFGAPAGLASLGGVGTLFAQRSGFGVAALSGEGTITADATQGAGAALSGVGSIAAVGGLPAPAVVNQWAANYGQGITFGTTVPAAQSCVVPLNPASSVGGGSGVATAGNWLFAIASWTQTPAVATVHVGASDDIHSWWRQFPASAASGNVRTSVSYTPNLARSPQYVYVAPDGAVAAINVLVVEISGLGPWDTLVGTNTNYAAAATSLSLSQNHTGTDFFIAGVGGDNVASGQAFAPGGWTTLVTQTQTNGTDHTCDNILTSAFLPSSLSNQSVSASASSAEDMSGFLLAVKVAGDDPIPATQQANWPYTIFEAAFGAGFNTPNSELTWTDLTTRLWSWDETSGIQYQLGQLQATNLNLEVDNFDGALTPVSSPWGGFPTTGTPSAHSYFTVSTAAAAAISVGDGFTDTVNAGSFFTVTGVGVPSGGNVNVSFTPAAGSVMTSDTVTQASLVSGTPIRVRMAMGTLGGQVINRWYVLQRNVHEWEEEANANYRRFCPVSGTDLWSAMSSVPPSFYRAEIYEDAPADWWPMDDQPGEGGVQPTTLLNAAAGSSAVMNITASPSGVTAQPTYGANGTNLTSVVNTYNAGLPPSVATYAAGTNSGWMYGDPPSSASSFSSATGNPVESSAGSASWQQAGQLGSTGSNGWFLSASTTFPGLSSGVTVKGWFNCGFYGSASGFAYIPNAAEIDIDGLGQPHAAITVATLATASAPVAILQLDTSGHLNLITYNGTTGTSHSIYSASDLRCGGWIAVDMLLTTTTWQVLLNGGLTANVSGPATGMTSAWTYLILCGDMGTSGGASPSAIQHGGNMALAHWAVFGYQVPAWRLLAHYTAAITGYGLLPAPVVSLQQVVSDTGTLVSNGDATTISATPDGWIGNGKYGGPNPSQEIGMGGNISTFSFSALMTATAGGYSSAPSARAVLGALGGVTTFGANSYAQGAAMFVALASPNAPAYDVYTSAAAGNETEASVILGAGDTYSNGYGASATGHGVSEISGGSGAPPPTAATALGDTAGQRIERLMNAGRTTSPQRSIDPDPDLVQAPGISGGGQQSNTSIQAIQQSTSGLLAVDNVGNLFYWDRAHLASQYGFPVWTLTPDAPPTPGATATAIPYYLQYRLVSDPQRIFNVITVQPFSPSGAQLPEYTPAAAAGVAASQSRYGAQAYPVTSWLQDPGLQQAQANWIFANFGTPQVRAENVRVDAAPYPAAFEMVMGINIGDIVTLTEWQIGGGGQTLTLRVTEINRKIRFGGQDGGNAGGGTVVAECELTLDAEPATYWGVASGFYLSLYSATY
jgi:hypothetical protein